MSSNPLLRSAAPVGGLSGSNGNSRMRSKNDALTAEQDEESEGEEWVLIGVDRHRGDSVHRVYGLVYCSATDSGQTPVVDEVQSWRSRSVILRNFGQSGEVALARYDRSLLFFLVENLPLGTILLPIQRRVDMVIDPRQYPSILSCVTDPQERIARMPCALCGSIGTGSNGILQCAFNPGVDTESLRCRMHVCASCRNDEEFSSAFEQNMNLASDVCPSCVSSDVSRFLCTLHTGADFECAATLSEYRCLITASWSLAITFLCVWLGCARSNRTCAMTKRSNRTNPRTKQQQNSSASSQKGCRQAHLITLIVKTLLGTGTCRWMETSLC